MKKVVIAMLLVALFVVPAFAIYNPVLTATVGFAYDKDGFAFDSASVSADCRGHFSGLIYSVGYTYGDEEFEDGFHVGASYSTDTNSFGKIGATVNFADSIDSFKAETIDLSYYVEDSTILADLEYELGFRYSFDKDPAKTGFNFAATYTTDTDFDCLEENSFSVAGTVHRIDDKLKLEGFEAKYEIGNYDEDEPYEMMKGASVAYNYSYDKPAEVNGIYATVVDKEEEENSTVVTASVHKVDDKIKFEVNNVDLSFGNEGLILLGAEYVYAFDNDAADNGFFGYIIDSYTEVCSFGADFKVEDWKIADWSLNGTVGFPFDLN